MGGAGAGAAGVVQLALVVLDLGLVHADHLLVVQLPILLVFVVQLLGVNSIDKCWLEFWYKNPLEIWLEISYTKKRLKNG